MPTRTETKTKELPTTAIEEDLAREELTAGRKHRTEEQKVGAPYIYYRTLERLISRCCGVRLRKDASTYTLLKYQWWNLQRW